MEVFFIILINLSILTYFFISSREKVLRHRKFENLTEELDYRVVEIRYLHPTDSEQNMVNEYYARLYITEKGLILIPEMSYVFGPDIFLFVTDRIYADTFPKPTFLCEINDFKITPNMTVVISKVKEFLNTNSEFEMIFESPNDNNLTDDLRQFLEKTDL